ncbi:hypothetical protein pb186bvf_001152 [Paramecium bursaria]
MEIYKNRIQNAESVPVLIQILDYYEEDLEIQIYQVNPIGQYHLLAYIADWQYQDARFLYHRHETEFNKDDMSKYIVDLLKPIFLQNWSEIHKQYSKMSHRINQLDDNILKNLNKLVGERIQIEGVKFIKKNYINISNQRLEDYGIQQLQTGQRFVNIQQEPEIEKTLDPKQIMDLVDLNQRIIQRIGR